MVLTRRINGIIKSNNKKSLSAGEGFRVRLTDKLLSPHPSKIVPIFEYIKSVISSES
jgi:hypothetical protein